MNIRKIPIHKIKPAEYNPRKALTPKDEEYQSIKRSIEAFDLVEPLVWNERNGNLVSGHQRLQVMKDLGHKEVEVSVVNLDPRKERALNVAMNKISGAWDIPKLKDLLVDLDAGDMDITLTGFSDEELKGLVDFEGKAPAGDPDSVPETPKTAITKRGDVWQLGDHRLMCGDSTSPDDMGILMNGQRASLIFTDPPYGVSYVAKSGKHAAIAGDEKRSDELVRKLLLPAIRLMSKHAAPTAAFYIWHASSTREDFAYAMKAAGLVERQYLIWNKGQIVLGWGDYLWAHEPCFYAAKENQTPAFYGSRGESTVWEIARTAGGGGVETVVGSGVQITDGHGHKIFIAPKMPKGKKLRSVRLDEAKDGKTNRVLLADDNSQSTVWTVSRDFRTEHPTQKPVELSVRAIENSSVIGEIVLDSFGGSGSTLIGATRTDRRCYAMEMEPKYCDVIVRRWEQYTGKKAVRIKGARRG